jgi:hypothetical protein
MGQDGHDLTSASAELKPNGYQDIHIALSGLPPRKVRTIVIRPYGGGEWHYNGPPGSWQAALERNGLARSADLYLEPDHVETGREYQLHIVYDDGTSHDIAVRGGKANPNRRMAQALPVVRWVGQDRHDLTGPGPSVGPDGLQDVHLELTNLGPKAELRAVALEGPGKTEWQSGLNPRGASNAELVRNPADPTRADVFFQADRDLTQVPLRLFIAYANGRIDRLALTGGRSDPKLRMPRVELPALLPETIEARWLGQDAKRGEVRVALRGLPSGRTPGAAVLSNGVQGQWIFRNGGRVKLDPRPWEMPLGLRPGKEPGTAELTFTPFRDEADASFTLRLMFEDGKQAVVRFAGGACDPFRGIAQPAAGSVVARPGDDLNALAGRFGTVTLAEGTHRLTHPLVLEKPVVLRAERGATIVFDQSPSDPPWTAAVKIHSGATTLEGFAIRFAGPVRWNGGVSFGPAVIGMTDNLDPPHPDPKRDLKFVHLDIEGPPSSRSKDWEEAPRLMRLVNGGGGRITNCVLNGGPIEFFSGPWQFLDNEYRGTAAGTYCHGVFVGHEVGNLVIRGNRARPAAGSGKTWRFLVLTGRGYNVLVQGNTIEAIGPRDDDTIPSHNAPEVILTESYRIRFEGKLAAVSADRRIVAVDRPQGDPPGVGDVVSVLSGPAAGRWTTIAEAITPTTYLLGEPLPEGAETVAIGVGFRKTRFEENTIDSRGGRGASNLVLAGNHFGTILRKNTLIGGGESFRIMAAPTEQPVAWGWSHAPYLGGVLEGNLLVDAHDGGIIGVEHTPHIKSNRGRTYMTFTLRDNVVRWSDEFLRARAREKKARPLRGITVGYPQSLDPDELLVVEKGDRLEAPASFRGHEALRVNAARLNGRQIEGRSYRLPASAPK